MYRVWFTDLEKAINAFRSKVPDELFSSIQGNAFGDFVITLDENSKYIVKHDDWSVWKLGDWRKGRAGWQQL